MTSHRVRLRHLRLVHKLVQTHFLTSNFYVLLQILLRHVDSSRQSHIIKMARIYLFLRQLCLVESRQVPLLLRGESIFQAFSWIGETVRIKPQISIYSIRTYTFKRNTPMATVPRTSNSFLQDLLAVLERFLRCYRVDFVRRVISRQLVWNFFIFEEFVSFSGHWLRSAEIHFQLGCWSWRRPVWLGETVFVDVCVLTLEFVKLLLLLS